MPEIVLYLLVVIMTGWATWITLTLRYIERTLNELIDRKNK